MGTLKNTITEVLKDTRYEADVVMRSSRDVNLTVVTDNLRGVCGITVIKVQGAAKPVSATAERADLNVKFFKMRPTMTEQISAMSTEARRVTGVYSFIVKNVRKVVNRIYK